MSSRKYYGFVSEDFSFIGRIANRESDPWSCKATIDASLAPIKSCSQTALGLVLTLKCHPCEGMKLTLLKRFYLGLAGKHQLDQFDLAEWESQ